MSRIFLDANVLFTAAHNPAGKAALLLELGRSGYFQIYTSSFALEEVRRNLNVKYPPCLSELERLLAVVIITPVDQGAFCPDSLPAKDAVIFRAAATCRATHLLTGDLRHFGPLMNRPELCNGIIVQTAAEFLAGL